MKLEHYFHIYNTSVTGLLDEQVVKNKKSLGSNIVTTKKREGILHILLIQLGSFFSVLLFIAATILFFIGDLVDFYILLIVIFVNSGIETIQRHRSDSIFESLTKIIPQYSVVIRNGKKSKIQSSEIVAGDIVLLQAGDKVSADGIIVMAESFKVDQSILTGESLSLSKTAANEYPTRSLIESEQHVFSGSQVVTGFAHMLVTHVGNKTEFGKIVQKISTIDTQLPLYKKIRKLSGGIFVFVLILTFFVLIIGLIQMQSWITLSKVAVALFVSAIPESLPVMLTLVLAYGFKRMGDKNVLVRKMQSLDVLGQIDVLALDKTGTITQNQMKVEKLFTFDGKEIYVTGNGYEPKGTFVFEKQTVSLENFPDALTLIKSAILSSTGAYSYDQNKSEWMIEMGDPTEVSLLVLGEKTSVTKSMLMPEYSLKKNIPFTNQNMYHSAIYSHEKKEIEIQTGAPEVIYGSCTHVRINGTDKKITEAHTKLFHLKLKEYSASGYRVLASSIMQGKKVICKGMFAINDSVRPDVYNSVQEVYARGIDIIMITGDHKEIALQIAQKIGISADTHSVLTGEDMSHLTDKQIKNILLQKKIFARVSPQQKLKILELFKEAGKTIAMTGDGINDALALVKADIGIAMGTHSSDSAKEAADIVLLDNKFGSIVYGIEEGKNIFSNIQKTILFLLSTNFAEMFVVVIAITLALPIPLSAIGILWLNLVTDTFLVIGFAFERGYAQGVQRTQLLGRSEWKRIIYLGLVMTCISLIVFMKAQEVSTVYAQSMTLLVLIVMQWFNVLNIRSGEHSIFTYGFKFNVMFVIGWIVSIGLTIIAFGSEFMRQILHIHPISNADWVYVILIASSIVWLEELRKCAKKIKLTARK